MSRKIALLLLFFAACSSSGDDGETSERRPRRNTADAGETTPSDAGINNTPCGGTCATNASCIGGSCVCDLGYEGSGTFCSDENECLDHPCAANATCTNAPGSFSCTCNEGFSGDGFTCTRELVHCGACLSSNDCGSGTGCFFRTCDARTGCFPETNPICDTIDGFSCPSVQPYEQCQTDADCGPPLQLQNISYSCRAPFADSAIKRCWPSIDCSTLACPPVPSGVSAGVEARLVQLRETSKSGTGPCEAAFCELACTRPSDTCPFGLTCQPIESINEIYRCRD